LFARISPPLEALGLFQTRRVIVAVKNNRATLKFNFFSMYQRSVFATPKSGILLGLHRVFQRPAVLNKAGHSSDPFKSRNPKIKLFLVA
jgi:hypothetical protein